MIPNEWINSKRYDTQEIHQQIVHGIFSVVRGRECVDVVHKAHPYNDSIDTKSNKRQKNSFAHAKVRS